MRSAGSGRAVIATSGIEIPLASRALTAQEVTAREAARTAAIEAAETAAARPAPTGRARAAAARRPSPSPVATVPIASAPARPGPAAPTGQLEAGGPDTGKEATAGAQLRSELAAAGEQIIQLQARVQEQAVCISVAAADLEASARRADLTAQVAADQVQALTARAQAAEQALAQARSQIQALAADLVAAVSGTQPTGTQPTGQLTDTQPGDRVQEPVLCEGGCGKQVDPGFTARTGLRRHRCCPAQAGRRAAA